MPLTRISLGTAWHPRSLLNCRRSFMSVWWRSSTFRQQIDFSLIERAADEQRIYDPHYLSEGRSARFVLFHIFAGNRAAGRRNRDSIVGSARG
ncbi:tautomerase [Klebsiella pneumoniae subsp. ozaenae]|uniref:Tautomerase n=1 Tax=Klebsiella pneumoniae subsp. ozaenae TaxID=574 RepID=A0A377ZMQ6_KLEPO|nr:tautomerase [Klebsiella pneumoniae subsp. ozaenae]